MLASKSLVCEEAVVLWRDLFVIPIPVLEKIIRTIAVYVLLIVLFRGIGKRGLFALNTFDFVVIFLLSNVVQNAVIGNDNSLLGGSIGAVTLVGVNYLVNWWLSRSDRAELLLEGRDTAVIRNGQVQARQLRRLAIRPEELDHAVRMQNGEDTCEVEEGLLSSSGHLIVSLKPEARNATKEDIDRLLAELARLHARLDEIDRRPASPAAGGSSA